MDGFDPDVLRWLGVLWGKSKERAGGRANLLLSHLLDTAAVAEQMWDHFLAPSTRHWLNEVAGGSGRGRGFFAWLCGIHDLGKATPAHQQLWSEGAQAVRAAGLTWHETTVAKSRWRHERASGLLLREALDQDQWRPEQVDWIWPMVAGHHGLFPSEGQLKAPRKAAGSLRGQGRWPQVQSAVVEWFTKELGFADLSAVQPVSVPSRAAQLHLSGLMVMADWIASDQEHFLGVDDLTEVTITGARGRAETAWNKLGLRGGWGASTEPGPEVFEDRFGQPPRQSQSMVLNAARQMEQPGLLIVEKPMGEGKTKAAWAAAEVLAARFGADGVFLGMPTQATSDPMWSKVRSWVGKIDPELAPQVALLHGKRMFNREWKALIESARSEPDARFDGVDEYGMDCEDDEFGLVSVSSEPSEVAPQRQAPAQWFLAAKRGLLCPFVVGTIDQLMFAATRTKHVMLRMAGLAGKVVVLDEVHAADVYMLQFLREGLRWLGQAQVPVVLLSATLAPAQRKELIDEYLAGAMSKEEPTLPPHPQPQGYPSVTAAWLDADRATPRFLVRDTPSWRDDLDVSVEVLPEKIPGPGSTFQERDDAQAVGDAAVGDLLERSLASGGCALVVRNTVDRAQSTYVELRRRFGDDVRVLHAQLTVQQRADLTECCLGLLGPPVEPGEEPGEPRPTRLILVATQLAEQSFDVDVDLLVTDVTAIDMLLQRIGRVHRHDGITRPSPVDRPGVVVTGFDVCGDQPPRMLYASEMIYSRYLLLRSMAEVLRVATPAVGVDQFGAAGNGSRAAAGWSIPSQVPELVRRVYEGTEPVVPASWADAESAAWREWDQQLRVRAENAMPYLLTRSGEHESPTLEGMHFAGASGGGTESLMEAVVRDGERGIEVILVVDDGDCYRTLLGRALTVNGDVPGELLEQVLGNTVRLPAKFTEAALGKCRPLPGWFGHPWLRHSLALVLDRDRRAVLGDQQVRYDDTLGLVKETTEWRRGW